jgi:hypothetical protein
MDVVIGIVLAVIYAAVELHGSAKTHIPDLPESRISRRIQRCGTPSARRMMRGVNVGNGYRFV